MRKRRSGGGSIVAQSVLGTIEPLQAESTRTEESEYRLLLVRVDLRELFVLGPSAVKILLRLEHAQIPKPRETGWHKEQLRPISQGDVAGRSSVHLRSSFFAKESACKRVSGALTAVAVPTMFVEVPERLRIE